MRYEIARRIKEAAEKLEKGDHENALIQICSAISGVAKHRYPSLKSGAAFKEFLRENLELITKAGFGNVRITQQWRLKYHHPDLKLDADGSCTIEDVIYHVIRCDLCHEGGMPSDIRFSTTGSFPYDDGPGLLLPTALISGLIFAVIVAPENLGGSIGSRFALCFNGASAAMDQYFGKKAELLDFFDQNTKGCKVTIGTMGRDARIDLRPKPEKAA